MAFIYSHINANRLQTIKIYLGKNTVCCIGGNKMKLEKAHRKGSCQG